MLLEGSALANLALPLKAPSTASTLPTQAADRLLGAFVSTGGWPMRCRSPSASLVERAVAMLHRTAASLNAGLVL
jgi:hypothetical protein